jgi:hypothetical protein
MDSSTSIISRDEVADHFSPVQGKERNVIHRFGKSDDLNELSDGTEDTKISRHFSGERVGR